jgi:Ca2+-binding EF-hand superfamily protein
MELTMNKFLLGGTALAALVAIAPAMAQSGQAPTAQRAPAVQAHSRAQLGTHVATMFQRLDANRDGFITREESQSGKGERGARKGDRQSRADRATGQRVENRAAMFDRIDANRDGMVSRDEFTRAPMSREQRLAAASGQNRRQRQSGAHGMRGGGMAGLHGRLFDMADANRDSRVSMQEATAAAYRHFDMADANRDGQVTRDERM